MSISFAAWMGETGDLAGNPTSTEESRAAAAWRRINDKPTSIVLKPLSGSDRPSQVVRLEWSDSVRESMSTAGTVPVRPLVIFGVNGHATVADTVIAEGDRFVYLSDAYRVVDVIYSIGEVQALAEAI